MTAQVTRRPMWRHPIVRIGGSALILAMLLKVLPFSEMKEALGKVPWTVWPIAIGVYMCLHLIGVAKWRILINVAGAELSFAESARAYYWGLFGNTFLPSIVGGDVVKAGVAMKAAKSKSGLVLGSLVDRLLDIVGMAAVAGIGALLSPRALDAQSRRIFIGLGLLLTVAGVGALVGVAMLPVRRFPFKVRRKLVQVRQAIRATAGNTPALVAALLLGMLLQSTLVILNYWLGIVIGISIPLYVWLFVWPLAKISGLLPVTQGGIGVREAAQAALFAPFGVSAVKAVATGLVFEAVIISGGLLGGAVAWVLGRRGLGAGLDVPVEPQTTTR
ncbi:MAG: lysylphosphatidylglycerol synthase transmembrane domain-containing protein [Gemmatimonadaceae bacterium]